MRVGCKFYHVRNVGGSGLILVRKINQVRPRKLTIRMGVYTRYVADISQTLSIKYWNHNL